MLPDKMSFLLSLVPLATLLAKSISAAPLLEERADLYPVITSDFPDPSIIRVQDTWYAFASQSEYDQQDVKVQLAKSTDFNNWEVSVGHDALRKLPPWVRALDPVRFWRGKDLQANLDWSFGLCHILTHPTVF
jgi:beta-xylosidase